MRREHPGPALLSGAGWYVCAVCLEADTLEEATHQERPCFGLVDSGLPVCPTCAFFTVADLAGWPADLNDTGGVEVFQAMARCGRIVMIDTEGEWKRGIGRHFADELIRLTGLPR